MNRTAERQPQPLLVHRGYLDAEELAALTAILHIRAVAGLGAAPSAPAHRRPTAGWRRPERGSGYDSPRNWRAGGRESS